MFAKTHRLKTLIGCMVFLVDVFAKLILGKKDLNNYCHLVVVIFVTIYNRICVLIIKSS